MAGARGRPSFSRRSISRWGVDVTTAGINLLLMTKEQRDRLNAMIEHCASALEARTLARRAAQSALDAAHATFAAMSPEVAYAAREALSRRTPSTPQAAPALEAVDTTWSEKDRAELAYANSLTALRRECRALGRDRCPFTGEPL